MPEQQSPMRFFVADTETTGLSADARIVELAWAEIDEDLNVVDRQYSLIDPEMEISSGASGIHGITAEDVYDAPTISEFFEFIYESPTGIVGHSTLIAHNTAYDRRFLAPWMPGLREEICTLRLARKVYPDAPDHKLSTLMYHLSLVRGEKHRASGDVDTCLDLLRKIVDKTGKSLPELALETNKPLFVRKMPFGKHRGLPLEQVPVGWISWLFKQNGEIDRDLRWSLEHVLAGTVPA